MAAKKKDDTIPSRGLRELEEWMAEPIQNNHLTTGLEKFEPHEMGASAAALATKPHHLRHHIMAVFYRLGGEDWLYNEAVKNPKFFLDMLKAIIPRNVDMLITEEPQELEGNMDAVKEVLKRLGIPLPSEMGQAKLMPRNERHPVNVDK